MIDSMMNNNQYQVLPFQLKMAQTISSQSQIDLKIKVKRFLNFDYIFYVAHDYWSRSFIFTIPLAITKKLSLC